MTPAIRQLRKEKVAFQPHLYRYQDKGGAAVSARELGVPEEQVVKTLVMEDEHGQPILVLMDGNHEVSTKNLARRMKVKSIHACNPEIAQKHTGYLVGGTSPFGTRKRLPVFMEKRILDQPVIYINGGKRGFLVSVNPRDLCHVFDPVLVEVGIPHRD